MKKVFLITGPANCGKTTVVRSIYDQLLPHAAVRFEEYLSDKEIFVILEIKDRVIGILSQGDPGSNIDRKLPVFISHNCDTVLCASRTRGFTYDTVNAIFSPDYRIERIIKKRVKTQDQEVVNKAMALDIISRISI